MNYPTLIKYISCFTVFAFLSSIEAKTRTTEYADTKQCHAHTTPALATSKKATYKLNQQPVKDAIYLEADQGDIRAQGVSTLSGNVIIQQNSTVFNADSAKINRINNRVTANGNVTLSDTQFKLKSTTLDYNLKNNTGTIKNAEYTLGNEEARGKSSEIKRIDEDRLTLKDATFSSCPAYKDSWHLSSSNIRLNNKTQIGTAKNVTLNVGKVPVFYFPWLNFPINDQRLSGFLTPSMRFQSNAGITIPYYLNLAPNYDATIKLSTLKGRGYQLDNEFRYLSKKHKGELEYNIIPQDRSFNNERRDYFRVDHRTQFNTLYQLNLNAEGVSDKEFFDDFSTSLENSTRPALKRRLEVIRTEKPWTASIALEDYQVIDSNDNPYSKLPEITLDYTPKTKPKDLKFELNSELIHFDKKEDVTGTRGDLKLKLSKKWGTEAWYLKPTVSLQHTLYSLSNTTGEDNINRTLPTLTLDSGLFFDREVKNTRFTQTLEPRVFYTYTPFKDQSNIPVFDTVRTDFSETNQLFLENRFTGKDRIADTNQLTFAVSSRIQDRKDGKELFKATIGQVFNFNDRKVTLPGGTILTGRRSDLILELTGRLNDNFRLASTASLKSEDRSVSNLDLRLNYQDEKDRIANLSYRRLDGELEQLSFSSALPINEKWSFVASADQDLRNNRNLESLVGVEYQDCCWKTRLVVKRFLTSDNINYETPVFLEFELKGLGNIGTSATRQIKEKIYGYDDFE